MGTHTHMANLTHTYTPRETVATQQLDNINEAVMVYIPVKLDLD